jgi:glycine/D-amino acid oxidase-like deaminating enzyme
LNFDYIIVGQGIAGSILSYQLIKQGKTVLVIDYFQNSSSSNIAAGIFNPVTGRKLVKTWLADTLFPATEQTFKELEEFLGSSFYHNKNVYRPFSNIKEQNDWYAKSEQADIRPYVIENTDNKYLNDYIQNNFGGSELGLSGNVDVAAFLKTYKHYLTEKECIINEIFDFDSLTVSELLIKYKDYSADKIIFCEGYKAIYNPYFNYLPFVLAKGEILTIKIEGCEIDKIISKGIFILPIGDNTYKVGSTYNWIDLTELPTDAALKDLTGKLNSLLKVPFTIIDHKAGIRPTVKDRRPFIGMHPKHNNVGIFNGLGTKGVALSGYFANHFVEHLLQGKELMAEANINRFEQN